MTDDINPEKPGIYRTKTAWWRWEAWRGWDGRHWSRGFWTRADCEEWCRPWLQADPPHMMPRDERESDEVTRWRV
jgi:hypothetical protein